MSILATQVKTIKGETTALDAFSGKVLLLVNVASKCGLTPQYAELEALYKDKQAQGFEVLGFPCNQFKGQEPGTEAEIQEFCSLNYGVSFPLFSKIEVNGADRHPLYVELIKAQPKATPKPAGQLKEKLGSMGLLPADETDIMWNFEKFLVAKDGKVIARFAPDVSVTSEEFLSVLNKALA